MSLDVPLTIDPEGDVWIPDYGRVRLAGLTLAEGRERVQRVFRGETRGLRVDLRLVRLRRFVAYVLGEVRTPGAVEVTGITRLSEAIRLAGGATDRATHRNVVIRSRNGAPRTVDLLRFDRTADNSQNPYLVDGDVVMLPPRARTIGIHAPVAYPGQYEFRTGDTLAGVLQLTGPFEPDAALDRAILVRFVGDAGNETLHVDLRAVPDASADLELHEGDRLFVPSRGDYHRDRNVSVFGEVVHPGLYPLVEGRDRVSQLVQIAGGVTDRGNPRSVLVVRRASTTDDRDPELERLSKLTRSEMTESEYQALRSKLIATRATHVVDLTAFVPNPERSAAPARLGVGQDLLLESGDVIFVERQSFSIQVGGEVRRPGLYEYDANLRRSDYVRLAGGYSKRANSGGTRLTRASSGQTFLLGDSDTIEPGDVLYVPEKKDVNVWNIVRDTILVGGSVATIILAFRRLE
jgi:protein involved in polysaccharide export with SLBB domain